MFVFEKKKLKFNDVGLIPMIIQDSSSGAVLSLFYANSESIKKMQETGLVWRYSRKNKKVMMKGVESGNTQKVDSISLDCDEDALLVKVSPVGPACHKGSSSCFSDTDSYPIISELIKTIKERKETPNSKSYTSLIVNSRIMISQKLFEEIIELTNAHAKEDIIWEAADVLFFLFVYLENRDIKFGEVLKELEERRKRPARDSTYGKIRNTKTGTNIAASTRVSPMQK